MYLGLLACKLVIGSGRHWVSGCETQNTVISAIMLLWLLIDTVTVDFWESERKIHGLVVIQNLHTQPCLLSKLPLCWCELSLTVLVSLLCRGGFKFLRLWLAKKINELPNPACPGTPESWNLGKDTGIKRNLKHLSSDKLCTDISQYSQVQLYRGHKRKTHYWVEWIFRHFISCYGPFYCYNAAFCKYY